MLWKKPSASAEGCSLTFKSQKQICESCGVNTSKLSQYSVLDLAESLTEEEEPQELVLPLDDIKLTYKDGVTHLQASKYLNSDRYSVALSGVAQQILGISLSMVCNLYAQDAEDLLPTQWFLKILGILKYTDIVSPPLLILRGTSFDFSPNDFWKNLCTRLECEFWKNSRAPHNSQRSLFGSGPIIPFGSPILGLIDPGSDDH